MSYTPHTWQSGEKITAAKMNNIEEGVQEAAQSGGGSVWDLVVKIDTYEPNSSTIYTVLSGDTAENLYDKAIGGDPVLVLLVSYVSSGDGFTISTPYICEAVETSSDNPDMISFSTYFNGESYVFIYDDTGVHID